MYIIFDFYDEIFEVKCDEPSHVINGRHMVNLLPLTFNIDSWDDPFPSTIEDRMALQMSAFRNQPSAASVYKFNALLYTEDMSWSLTGCFINSVDWMDFTDKHMVVELSIDHIPELFN